MRLLIDIKPKLCYNIGTLRGKIKSVAATVWPDTINITKDGNIGQ